VGISPVKTQLLAIAEIALRKSVLPYSCFPMKVNYHRNALYLSNLMDLIHDDPDIYSKQKEKF
jgi:hypothetical protein